MVKHRAVLLSKSAPTYKLKKTENMSIQKPVHQCSQRVLFIAGLKKQFKYQLMSG